MLDHVRSSSYAPVLYAYIDTGFVAYSNDELWINYQEIIFVRTMCIFSQHVSTTVGYCLVQSCDGRLGRFDSVTGYAELVSRQCSLGFTKKRRMMLSIPASLALILSRKIFMVVQITTSRMEFNEIAFVRRPKTISRPFRRPLRTRLTHNRPRASTATSESTMKHVLKSMGEVKRLMVCRRSKDDPFKGTPLFFLIWP